MTNQASYKYNNYYSLLCKKMKMRGCEYDMDMDV